jgi:antitoxin component YwqK of YwqJK toxin-antitoxin module
LQKNQRVNILREQEDGKHKFWDENGKLEHIWEYRKGETCKLFEYNDKGWITYFHDYDNDRGYSLDYYDNGQIRYKRENFRYTKKDTYFNKKGKIYKISIYDGGGHWDTTEFPENMPK